MAEFHKLGTADEVGPGEIKQYLVEDRFVALCNVEGEFHAFEDVCTHQFGPLCAGTVNGTTACDAATGWRFAWVREGEIVTCPWHGLEFDITTGRCLAAPKVRLRQFPVTVEDGQVTLTL